MKKIIDNWVHIPGLHCGSVALRDVITYYGYQLSEAMCFGLGSGLGFFYTQNKDMSPTRLIHLRGAGMEPNFFSLIDKPTEWKLESDRDRAFEILRDYINQDIPVLIQTDIFHLDYYRSSTHFPGHVVSVWGYDDGSEKVFLSDTAFEGLQAVSYEALKNARSSKAKPYPLNNNWFEVYLGNPLPELSKIVPNAIYNNAKSMLDGTRSSRGMSGIETIRAWAEELEHWGDAPDWQWSSRFAYQVIEKRGTGGGGFRWIYRDFLSEAEEIIPNLKALRLPDKMDLLGRKWSDISVLLKQLSECEKDLEPFRLASNQAHEIANLEEAFYREVVEKLS
ncbi:MAG: BtrH N-terminal domain-containing protein [Deltaproteobacteria bacterium]|nr:BtrH N-terminal domain-containing protein [Deltaproteobacteria bacterium]